MKSNNQALRLLQTCMNENSSLWAEVDILRKALYKMKSKWRLEPIFRGTISNAVNSFLTMLFEPE